MSQRIEQPFDSIESAYDFLRILSETVTEAKRDLEGDVQRESSSGSSRRLDALRIAFYSVEKLELHINHSRRILNDLRSLRRLLFAERATPKAAIGLKPVAAPAPEMPAAAVPAPLPSQVAQVARVARVRAKGGSAVAA
jgi:hypothetical protein